MFLLPPEWWFNFVYVSIREASSSWKNKNIFSPGKTCAAAIDSMMFFTTLILFHRFANIYFRWIYPIFCIVWFFSSFLHFFFAAVSFLWVIFHTLIFNHGRKKSHNNHFKCVEIHSFRPSTFQNLAWCFWHSNIFQYRNNMIFIEIEHFLWYYLVWCGKIDIFMLPLTSLCGTGEENARMVCRWREWSDFFLLTKYKYLKTSPSQRSTLEQNAYPS